MRAAIPIALAALAVSECGRAADPSGRPAQVRLLRARPAGNISTYVEFVLDGPGDRPLDWRAEVRLPSGCACTPGRLHWQGRSGARLAGQARRGALVRLFYYPGQGPPGSAAAVLLLAGPVAGAAAREIEVPNF